MPHDYIITYTGVRFVPLAPRREDVCAADIAHALSLMTRANGHIPHFYSVAQHSVNCAREALARGEGNAVQLACLLHDASEAYLSDITRPVKQNFPTYREAERELQTVIFAAFGVPADEQVMAKVAEIDDTMLWHEFMALKGERIFDGAPVLHGTHDFSLRPFQEMEDTFLALLANLVADK